MIKVTNLTKIYKSKNKKECVALDKINFTLPDKGLVYIIGKSGSGKSTLLNLIAGLDTITSGSIVIDGNEVGKMKSNDFDKYRSSYLTFVFQDYKLLENLNVYQNIEVGLDVNDSLNHEVIKNSLSRVGLADYAKRYPYELSGGQQQRVAIARALARNSKLILADEPTGNLDFNTSRQILAILKEVSKEKLVVVVSHNLMDADIYADRIIELYEGKIITDKVKRNNYTNSFKIDGNTITLPHYHDLNIVQQDKMLNAIKSNEITNIVQNDNGFIDTIDSNDTMNEYKITSKKAKNRSLFKIFKMFLRKRVHNRIIMIIFSILLFTVLSVLQSFILFEPSPSKVDKDEELVVIHKGETVPFESSLRAASIYHIEDSEYKAFKNISKGHEIFKLSSYFIPYTNRSQASTKNLTQMYQYSTLYNNSSLGTLICNEKFLGDLFLNKGEIEVLYGNLNDKSYGIIITDYMADALIYHKMATSYEDVLGEGQYSAYSKYYVNAVIKTDYKEKYKDIENVYSRIDSEESFYNEFNHNELFREFIDDCEKKLNIAYSLNPNFREEIIDINYKGAWYLTDGSMKSSDYVYEISRETTNNVIYSEVTTESGDAKVNRGEVCLSATMYNRLFGTMYTTSNYDLSVNNSFTLELYSNIDGKRVKTYSKEFKIIRLTSYTWFDEEDYKEILDNQMIDYALYCRNYKDSNDLIKYGNDHGFYLKTVDFESGIIINKITSTFNNLFTIILICIYAVFAVYIISYGVNSVRFNKEEIGIYKSLGGKFRNICKVLFIDVLLTGLIISILSIFFTPLIINICDDILVESFKNVLHLGAASVSVVKIYPSVLALNYSLLNMLILISAVVPVLVLMRLKPIEIIKK